MPDAFDKAEGIAGAVAHPIRIDRMKPGHQGLYPIESGNESPF